MLGNFRSACFAFGKDSFNAFRTSPSNSLIATSAISFRILEVGQPQIIVWHRRDEVRLKDELNAARAECLVNLLDIVHLVVDDRRGMIDLWTIGDAHEQAYATAVKECHVRRRLKKKCHTQHISIKHDCSIEVLRV